MKTIITLSIALVSSLAIAKSATFNQNCESQDKTIQLSIETVYPNKGDATSTTSYLGVPLKSVKGAGPKYLKGNTTGDMDNFQNYQLILLESAAESSEAILITENHVDRVGYENTVEKLTCTYKK